MPDEITNCGDLDERLASYVDGEGTAESRRAVNAHLTMCPECRTQADAEAAARTIVRGHREGLGASAPESLRARCEAIVNRQSAIPLGSRQSSMQSPVAVRRSAIRRWAPLSLAATILLAVAGVFILGLNDRVEALASSLVLDHVKCFAMPGNPSQTDLAQSASRWQQDQGWPITVPPAEPAEELKLVNVRRCFTADGRAAHMLYTWRGAPLSVYVLQENAGRDCVVNRMGHEAAIWCANGRTYAVVADGQPRDLDHIIDYMKARVR